MHVILRLLQSRSVHLSAKLTQIHPVLGWHMACLQPPLEQAPTGIWHCPMCPPLPPKIQTEFRSKIHITANQGLPSNFQPIHTASVVSTSYSHKPRMRTTTSRKGKGKAIFMDESEIKSPLTRRQHHPKRNSKVKVRTREKEEESELDPTPRTAKRMKLMGAIEQVNPSPSILGMLHQQPVPTVKMMPNPTPSKPAQPTTMKLPVQSNTQIKQPNAQRAGAIGETLVSVYVLDHASSA
jgi:hypothetical protein